jgi:hypothetical protein
MRNEAKALPFAICDARTASIYEGTLVPGDRVHIERVDRLISPWLAFHDHGRPSLLAMGPTANARQWFADEHREPLELERRFAKDVAHWLKQHAHGVRRTALPRRAAWRDRRSARWDRAAARRALRHAAPPDRRAPRRA